MNESELPRNGAAPPATFRILDANANRASEGLRVVEEFVRFVLEDSLLSQGVKSLRHDLATWMRAPEVQARWKMRDAAGDVGAEVSTESEHQRSDLREVAIASLCRTTQAMRCLEEYSKLLNPNLGQRMEAMRFQAYDLERNINTLLDSQSRLDDCHLYVLVDGGPDQDAFAERVELLIQGGVDMIQLRDKRLNDRDLLRRGQQLRRQTQGRCLLIINDRVDLAIACEADGVHLGQDEFPIREARRLLGPHPLIGVSTHNVEQVKEAASEGASYLGCGPTFPSQTKTFEEFPGIPFLEQAAATTSLPMFAIGGIGEDNLKQITALGIRRVAVGAAVWSSSTPDLAARTLRKRLIDN